MIPIDMLDQVSQVVTTAPIPAEPEAPGMFLRFLASLTDKDMETIRLVALGTTTYILVSGLWSTFLTVTNQFIAWVLMSVPGFPEMYLVTGVMNQEQYKRWAYRGLRAIWRYFSHPWKGPTSHRSNEPLRKGASRGYNSTRD